MSASTVVITRDHAELTSDAADLIVRALAACCGDEALTAAAGLCAPTPGRIPMIGALVGEIAGVEAGRMGFAVESLDRSRVAVMIHVAPQFNHALLPALETAFFGAIVARAASRWLADGGFDDQATLLAERASGLRRQARDLLCCRIPPPDTVAVLPSVR